MYDIRIKHVPECMLSKYRSFIYIHSVAELEVISLKRTSEWNFLTFICIKCIIYSFKQLTNKLPMDEQVN